MNRNHLPVIATDIDGVVVKWQSGLPYFAQKYNLPLQHILDLIISDEFFPPHVLFNCDEDLGNQLIKKYNNSDFIRYLAPYADALAVINKLKNKYRFVAVTALGEDVESLLNRKFNLNALFPDAFDDIYVCGHAESKETLLRKVNEKYGNKVIAYIDDMPSHVDMAESVLSCPVYWMPRGPRDKNPECKHYKALDWNDIEAQITKNSIRVPVEFPDLNKNDYTLDDKHFYDILEEIRKLPISKPELFPGRFNRFNNIPDGIKFPYPYTDNDRDWTLYKMYNEGKI